MWIGGLGWGWHFGKGVYLALWFWRFGTSQLHKVNQKQSNSRCHGICKLSPRTDAMLPRRLAYSRVYIHIGVGSALLVSINWAMRRPQNVGRVTGTGSHAFSFCVINRGYSHMGNSGDRLLESININTLEVAVCSESSKHEKQWIIYAKFLFWKTYQLLTIKR